MSGEIIESQWVYVDPTFALTHPSTQSLGAIWFVIGWIALHLTLALWFLVEIAALWLGVMDRGFLLAGPVDGGLWLLVFVTLMAAFAVVDILALIGLLGRHPLARIPVWITLVLTFPLSLPLVVYWADGVKPNLLYAHRFERMVDPEKGVA